MATLKSKVVNGKKLYQLTFGPKEATALEAAMYEFDTATGAQLSGLSRKKFFDLYELIAQAAWYEV